MQLRVILGWLLLGVFGAGLGVLSSQAQKKPAIPFPTGYRSWNHVKTMVIFSKEHKLFEQFGGLHSVYVNGAGLTALQQGKGFPEGSVLVFDLHDIRTVQGAIETRDRKFIGVMRKNSKAYPGTGGWGFELFRGYQEVGSLRDMKACFDCHAERKAKDYVFSDWTP